MYVLATVVNPPAVNRVKLDEVTILEGQSRITAKAILQNATGRIYSEHHVVVDDDRCTGVLAAASPETYRDYFAHVHARVTGAFASATAAMDAAVPQTNAARRRALETWLQANGLLPPEAP